MLKLCARVVRLRGFARQGKVKRRQHLQFFLLRQTDRQTDIHTYIRKCKTPISLQTMCRTAVKIRLGSWQHCLTIQEAKHKVFPSGNRGRN